MLDVDKGVEINWRLTIFLHSLSTRVEVLLRSTRSNTKRAATYLKTEMSQSQEWRCNATKRQTAAAIHTIQTIAKAILDTF